MRRLRYVLWLAVAAIIGAASVGALWASSGGETELQVNARWLADGRVEVTVQQREAHGWSERLLSADAPAGRWRNSSAVKLSLAPPGPCPSESQTLRYGFFALFAPVSYSADSDPQSDGYHTHLGYEAALLNALETMDDTNLAFDRIPISVWPEIWLAPATPEFDLAGGGITILESRTRDAGGRTVVAFTDGHISFRQALLVRAADADRFSSHSKLTSSQIVGVVAGTTGEARLLQLTGLSDERGVLVPGVRIETPNGERIADGSDDFVLSAAYQSPALAGRTRLLPASDDAPQVVYLGGDEAAYLTALRENGIDAFARGEIGNRETAHASAGAFAVTALDPAVELGGFSINANDTELLFCLNQRINWLTNDRAIGYAEWLEHANVFSARAEAWNDARSGALRAVPSLRRRSGSAVHHQGPVELR